MTCNLPSLSRQRVAIARLKHPANMGSTSQEVRLFALVLCPSKECYQAAPVQQCYFCPMKGTKNSLETGRTFSTLLADLEFRQKLLEAHSEDEFKQLLSKQAQILADEQNSVEKRLLENHVDSTDADHPKERWCQFGKDIMDDLCRRLPLYISDYTDGLSGSKTIQKVISSTLFLYFACILPAIAFGVLNSQNTHGLINVKRVIIGQTIGGLTFVILSGQPLTILLTTAPLSIYIKIIYNVCEDFQLDFFAMYCCVGLWNAFFLICYSLFGVSRLMRWSTRSTEEIFALFISVAFCVDVTRDVIKDFANNYYSPGCMATGLVLLNESEPLIGPYSLQDFSPDAFDYLSANSSPALPEQSFEGCRRESSILFLFLMLGTLWLGVFLYNFNKTMSIVSLIMGGSIFSPLTARTRAFIVINVEKLLHTVERFKYDDTRVFNMAALEKLSVEAIFAGMGLGFSLSLLFFMDQNISSAMVNNPCNKLKKGPGYHLDLFVVAVLNAFLSIFGLPWVHGAIPHSPLHVRSLADVEERVDQGHVHEMYSVAFLSLRLLSLQWVHVVTVRETRLTGMFAHVLIGLSILMLPLPLAYIPTAVLDGLFLYMAVTALNGNQMFERITLLFTEQHTKKKNEWSGGGGEETASLIEPKSRIFKKRRHSVFYFNPEELELQISWTDTVDGCEACPSSFLEAAYPPNHYIRRVPQRKIHQFTACQVLQLLFMCVVGFYPWPYVKMVFPILLLVLMPLRHKVIPKLIEKKFLDALDAQHQ
ncbi:unnamed protein product [Darwinula stevensoni]|uniref:Bicarbonate transporter-like transmembrane domain-containing protein n=1 Tax=Darwinula stevensoni TaxID=69355 RepID=A0A7R8XIP9_9CRUS|nr:unnamed protein product [Darwinula stevensoni]CAG0891454.1 unnamed protein product [Darwinula stevensoni]